MFRFNYSPEFLRWVLKPPGWDPEWFVGVRVHKQDKKGKLVGFISAIPCKIRVYDKYFIENCLILLLILIFNFL